jgi:ornithine carbamoyltransferase
MNTALLHHRHLGSLDELTSADLSSLLQTAGTLKAAAVAGRPQQPLRGKNIAVMSEAADDQALQGLTAAASALGARVAHIRPSSSRITQPGESQETAQLLGRLYDAIDCEGLPPAVVRDLERGAGRPVFNGLAEAGHPLRMLGDLLTLREHSGKPFHDITVCFCGDATSPAGQAWRQSAELAGFSLNVAAPGDPRAEMADYICDERDGPRSADGRIELACGCHGAGGEAHRLLGREQMANHHYALQALLCSAVS